MIKTCKGCGDEFETNRSKRDYCGRSCSNKVIARNRENDKLNGEFKTVWSCGGGVQSTAIAALIYKGELPKPDYALMVDCGYDKSTTWDYVHGVLIPKMKEIGVDLQVIKTTDYSTNDLFDKSGYLRIPAFTKIDSKVIKYKTRCNNEFKVRPIQKWLREQGVKYCESWMGISLDEARRARESTKNWFELRYPLLELSLSRDDCLWLIGSLGWPKPPRTSCYICPQQDDAAWIQLRKNSPEDWQKAVEIEKQIQSRMPNVYLHRSLIKLSDQG